MVDKKILLCPWCQTALQQIDKPWLFKYQCKFGCNKIMKIELVN